jgi:hypothetical protein
MFGSGRRWLVFLIKKGLGMRSLAHRFFSIE